MRATGKTKGVVKGAPSGFVISLAVHAAAFLLAGMLVVFSVHQKDEKKFVPPTAVDRPKMKLKKPQVKVKKNAKPKSSSRIVTHVKRADMPDIQLPEMSGIGEGFGGEGMGGGFDMMPDLAAVTLLGSGQSIGNDFVGTFYDLKRTRDGRKRPVGDALDIADPLRKFVRSGWKPSILGKYYRSSKKLYATSFVIPRLPADLAPEAFGEMETEGWGWAVHYKGKLVHKDGITFRFRGGGDSVLIVRLDGKIILDGNYERFDADQFGLSGMTGWLSKSSDDYKYWLANARASVSDWITLEPGVPLDMEILLGDTKGYGVSFMLCVEEEGVEYPISRYQPGAPILPIFKTADPSRAAQDQMHAYLTREEISTTTGPIFNDFESGGHVIDLSPKPILVEQAESQGGASLMRMWTTHAGKTIEAQYVTVIGDKVVLKSAAGKQLKVLLTQLSAQDIEYIDLINEPAFNIDFVPKSKNKPVYRSSPYTIDNANFMPPKVTEWTFGAKLKQTSARTYNHELKVEYFAIGVQMNDKKKFILLDRGESTFVPTKENGQSHQFRGEACVLQVIVDKSPNTGCKYDTGLVVVTDKRGKIIAHSASRKWLLEHVDALRILPVNAYFDQEGRRVLPTNTISHRY